MLKYDFKANAFRSSQASYWGKIVFKVAFKFFIPAQFSKGMTELKINVQLFG